MVGPLVHFGSPTATDISRYRDYFTPRTNFDLDGCSFKARIYYDHGLYPVIRQWAIGSGRMTAFASRRDGLISEFRSEGTIVDDGVSIPR